MERVTPPAFVIALPESDQGACAFGVSGAHLHVVALAGGQACQRGTGSGSGEAVRRPGSRAGRTSGHPVLHVVVRNGRLARHAAGGKLRPGHVQLGRRRSRVRRHRGRGRLGRRFVHVGHDDEEAVGVVLKVPVEIPLVDPEGKVILGLAFVVRFVALLDLYLGGLGGFVTGVVLRLELGAVGSAEREAHRPVVGGVDVELRADVGVFRRVLGQVEDYGRPGPVAGSLMGDFGAHLHLVSLSGGQAGDGGAGVGAGIGGVPFRPGTGSPLAVLHVVVVYRGACHGGRRGPGYVQRGGWVGGVLRQRRPGHIGSADVAHVDPEVATRRMARHGVPEGPAVRFRRFVVQRRGGV